jgi:hypothetical protein
MKNNKFKRLSIKKKYYSITFFIGLIFSVLLGFIYREPNAVLLIVLSTRDSMWQKDLFLEAMNKSEPFCSFTYFDFNWNLFGIFLLLFMLLGYFFTKADYYNKLVNYSLNLFKK